MMRTITFMIVIAFCLIGTISLQAEEQTALSVNLTDGTKVQFFLSELPVIVPQGEDVVFESTKATATYSRSNVVKFYFETVEVPNAVNEVSGKNETRLAVHEDYIVITSQDVLPMPVLVYSVSGVQIPTGVSRISESSVKIPIARLSQGVYIIRLKNQSFKFLKK